MENKKGNDKEQKREETTPALLTSVLIIIFAGFVAVIASFSLPGNFFFEGFNGITPMTLAFISAVVIIAVGTFLASCSVEIYLRLQVLFVIIFLVLNHALIMMFAELGGYVLGVITISATLTFLAIALASSREFGSPLSEE